MSAKMSPQARIRRLQDTLSVVGLGVIAFAAWSLMKAVLFFFLLDEQTQRHMFNLTEDSPLQLFYVVFAVVAAFDLAIRLYVGLSARAEGRGKRKGGLYLVVAAILAVASISNIILVMLGTTSSPTYFDLFMTFVVETTSVATLVLMVFCAIRLRHLNRPEE